MYATSKVQTISRRAKVESLPLALRLSISPCSKSNTGSSTVLGDELESSVLERVDNYRALLTNLVGVQATLVAQRQNDEMARMTEAGYEQNEQVKRISSWAAIAFAPTLVAGVYGMNFDHMPELHWGLGYPFAILLMIGSGGLLWALFKRNGWL